MRWLTLYLRSRRAHAAVVGVVACAAAMWSLGLALADTPEMGEQMVVLTVLLLVICLTPTLGGPDDEMERTAAFAWLPRRAAHLLVAGLLVTLLLLATLPTGARFGPAELVVRDAAGLLGLTALCAATLGTARAWFLPLAWTLPAVLFPRAEPVAGQILTWQAQPPSSTAATVTALLLALAGLAAYAMSGPVPRAPAEAAQQ
ncbi:hypothetical protein [Paractinoplanes atraurantiacus]|uniref:ABC-2 family transporter protein n=1 Tax=Paractinoplanes atraurantiacus TaxID=1036182 RepID=A0A285GNB8_9ACTN|nr:hypothetical protein [Actinoplanes atraurantiacus]SNY23996.1 hypothetical protein SAMN05421748_102123 [Actinoplanes atraurantiacus]